MIEKKLKKSKVYVKLKVRVKPKVRVKRVKRDDGKEKLVVNLIESAIIISQLEFKVDVLLSTMASMLLIGGGEVTISVEEGRKIREDYALRKLEINDDGKEYTRLTLYTRNKLKDLEEGKQ